jgi:hypothetical protein
MHQMRIVATVGSPTRHVDDRPTTTFLEVDNRLAADVGE